MGSTGTAYPPMLSSSFMAFPLVENLWSTGGNRVRLYYITGMPRLSFHYM